MSSAIDFVPKKRGITLECKKKKNGGRGKKYIKVFADFTSHARLVYIYRERKRKIEKKDGEKEKKGTKSKKKNYT